MKKPERTLFAGQDLTTIKVAEKPLSVNPEIQDLTVAEFNQRMGRHRGTRYEYCESIFTCDDSFKFSESKTALKLPLLSELVVCWINDTVGFGVYTSCEIPKGAPIAVYTGELRRKPEKNSTYALGGYEKTNSGQRICTVDAKSRSGIAGLIQSSLHKWEYYSVDEYPLQACNVEPQLMERDGIVFTLLVAADNIPKNSQLLVDYSLPFWDALREQGVIERAFSALDHCQTPPADLFTYSDEFTIPMMILMLDRKQLLPIYQNRLLENLARFHHSLLKVLPTQTQHQLFDFLTSLKRNGKPFESFIDMLSKKGSIEHKAMLECYQQKLSALSVAAEFIPVETAKPLISSMENTTAGSLQCPMEEKRRLVRLQVDAATAIGEGNVEQGYGLFVTALQSFSNIYQQRCACLQVGKSEYVIHMAIFRIHEQMARALSRVMPEKSFLHAFICYNMMQHPDIKLQLAAEKQAEISQLLDLTSQQFFTPPSTTSNYIKM